MEILYLNLYNIKSLFKKGDKRYYMETVMISACLVGDKVRYDGKGKYNPLVKEILAKYELLPLCPEVLGGLSIPRDKAEIRNDKVMTYKNKDVTNQYNKGAHLCINPIEYKHVKKAILQDRSPACGVHKIHNGKFNDELIDGNGILTRLLISRGIEVYTIEEFYEKFIKKDNQNNNDDNK